MKLILVESPNKTKKIASFLDSSYQVEASSGHIRDLPLKEMGVGPAPDYKPHYVISEGSRKRVARLKKLVGEADEIYLAMDLDREGEAIAFHLVEALNIKKHRRVVFNEITKAAVQYAVSNPGYLNEHLVKAQEARRVLDRLVGYRVSPALSDKLAIKASAGRVQSVAVRLVVERERAIRGFVVTDHFNVVAHFESEDAGSWSANWNFSHLLADAGAEGDDQKYWTDRDYTDRLVSAINNDPGFTVTNVQQRKRQRKAPCPFTTSLLQQAASSALKINPETCMKLAQSLFENGAITYHRTDSPNLSDEAISNIRDLVRGWEKAKGVDGLLPDQPNTWKSKDGAQEAHEAIRPTDVSAMSLPGLSEQEAALYDLIWRRAVSSQMANAIYDTTQISLLSDAEHQPFVAKGERMLFPGWRFLSREDAVEQEQVEENGGEQDQAMPALVPGQRLATTGSEVKPTKTRPPSRYTEATLVKALETEGVGRPSTFASIMSNIKNRGYITIKSRKIHADATGEQVVDALVGNFKFMELGFTRDAESELDRIAQGQATYRTLVGEYDDLLNTELSEFASLPAMGADGKPVEIFDCPSCAKPLRKIRVKKGNRSFWGCTAHPGCATTLPDLNGAPDFDYEPPKVEQSEIECPACQKGKMNRREGQFGHFWACNKYPTCKKSVPDLDGAPDWEAAERRAAKKKPTPTSARKKGT